MTTELNFTVDPSALPVRIDKYLADRIDRLSRNRIQQLIAGGSVWLNGQPVPRAKEKTQPGDRIQVFLPPPQPSAVEPEPIPLDILFEDNDLLAVNKPPGLCVHPTEHMKTGTLVNALLYRIKDLSGIGGILRPGIVHRLDRVTSGVLLVAKNDETHRRLSDQFKSRLIEKTYWALAQGAANHREGEIDQPIGRHPTDRKRMTIRPDGRKSLTTYRILRTGLGGSLVEVYPRTGRTHQIRVHLHHLGFSILGDRLYGLKKHLGRGTLERLFEGYPGIGLHAKRIRFTHPMTEENMVVEAPLPDLFQSIVDQMQCLNLNIND